MKKTASKIASQLPKKQVQKERYEKVEYARSVFLNARRPHIKSVIGYKNGDKHNPRVSTKGREFIKFTKANVQQEKKQSITNSASSPMPMFNKRRSKVSRPLKMFLILILMLLIFLISHAMISMLLMCL
jgi:hypothetical protein